MSPSLFLLTKAGLAFSPQTCLLEFEFLSKASQSRQSTQTEAQRVSDTNASLLSAPVSVITAAIPAVMPGRPKTRMEWSVSLAVVGKTVRPLLAVSRETLPESSHLQSFNEHAAATLRLESLTQHHIIIDRAVTWAQSQ